ncbi:MAG: Unknown protein [uncultured Sulfurovum sp.]|uniref:GmrSD restriction endonucleases N-terminal domain-containing protein n=1 Tax=uncultured Sulfurovum sp. TaxID=269237 RepID=A0A6S6UI73_9BACT|nr:MAG: Unknown protein [uncultured Sulfurovum sp.]
MQKYENTTIAKVMEEMNTRYFLPDIQRPYVWKAEQIYALYDSIMRGYPISTFLFWEQSAEVIDELTPRYEFIRTNRIEDRDKINTSNDKEKYILVLDGQQRLTSLYLTLIGNFVIRNKLQDLYFNILSGIEEDENGNIFEFKFFDYNFDKLFVDNDKLWINIKYLFSYIDEYDLEDFIEKFTEENNITLEREQKRFSKKLWSNLRSKELINYYPEREENMDKVLDIFVRTNAGGTKLSKSDLLFSTIKKDWGNARDEFKSLIATLNQQDKYRFSHDFILKTSLVLFSKTQEDIKYSVKNSKNIVQNIESNWKGISSAITLVINKVDNNFKLSSHKVISSYNALIPLIYFIYKNNLKTISSKDSLLMRRWLIKILLNGIFGGQSDTMLFISKTSIDNATTKDFPYQLLIDDISTKTRKSFDSVSNILDNQKLKYNSRDSYLLLSLLYSGNINFGAINNGNLPQQDHIFSKEELKENGILEEKINSIFNIQYLDAHINQSKSAMLFSQWLSKLTTLQKREHFIPHGTWDINNFDDFLKERRDLFHIELQKLI